MYVIIGIVIIWMAWSIFLFVINMLVGGRNSNCDYCYSLPAWEERESCLDKYNCLDF